jgi:hypothetical protein
MDHETVLAYLDRLGVTASTAGDAAGLRTLHRAHQMTVPFENLSIHLAEPISLIRCCWTPGRTKTIRPGGSGSPTPTRETSTS